VHVGGRRGPRGLASGESGLRLQVGIRALIRAVIRIIIRSFLLLPTPVAIVVDVGCGGGQRRRTQRCTL